jgi:uncharacterized protein YdbL (DUF1318 family)
MKTNFFRLFLLVTVLVFGVAPSQGQDLGAIKARMDQRLSKLDALKGQGAIGENNRGLVELRGGNAEAGDVVAAENRDREAVYAALAKQTGSLPGPARNSWRPAAPPAFGSRKTAASGTKSRLRCLARVAGEKQVSAVEPRYISCSVNLTVWKLPL